MNDKDRANILAEVAIGCAIEVHKHLGPGLLESVYEQALAFELKEAGLSGVRQKRLPVIYKGHPLRDEYRLDLLVEDTLIIEVKSVERLTMVHDAQLLTYLKLTGLWLGLLLNFNTPVMRQGIKRLVN